MAQIAILGAGLGGLSAAIHARLLGHDVLVIEGGTIGGKAAAIETHGYRLDPGPSIIILKRIYEEVFRRAGRNPDEYLQFERLDPISRVFYGTPDRPIDLPADRDECLRLVREIAPEDAESFAKLMTTLERVSPHIDRSVFDHPYQKPWQLADPDLVATAMHFDVRKTYKELVDGFFQSPLLRSFFYGFPSYGGQSYDSKAPGALMIPYLMLQEGVFYPRGGVAAIPQAFERLARELGVEFALGSPVASVETNGRYVRRVVLANGERHSADKFISNVDRLTTRQWLGHSVDWPPSFSYFTLHFGTRRRYSHLKHHTLLVPHDYEAGFRQLYREREFPNPPIVYLNVTSDTDPSAAPEGASNLFAVVTSPADEPNVDWRQRTDEYRQRVLATMVRFGVEIDPQEVDFERIQSPIYFEERHGNYRGSLYGPDEKHRLFGGLFPLRCADEDHPNLFYCGGSVQPGAGLPMVTLSGRFAAELAHKAK